MSGGPIYTIDQLLDPVEHKATHDGLADGSEDTDANKLELYRSEALNDFIASGGLWSADDFGVDLLGSMTSVVAYIGGKRVISSAVSAKAFTASKYTVIDLGDDGVIDYSEATSIATIATLATNHIRIAIIITNATDTTQVIDRRNLSPLSIARVKLLEGVVDDLWIESLPDYKFFRVLASLLNNGTVNGTIQFNLDAGTNYATRFSANFGATASQASSTSLPVDTGSPSTPLSTVLDIINTQLEEKEINIMTNQQSTAGAANVPNILHGAGKWVNTADLINLINIKNTSSGSWDKLSEMIISGSK